MGPGRIRSNLCLRLTLAAMLLVRSSAAQPEDDDDPNQVDAENVVTGIADPGAEDGDTTREVGNVVLAGPRTVIDYLFRGTQEAAQLVADEQLVPRYQRLFGAPPGGRVYVFPTFFAETGGPFSVGGRMIADTRRITTFQRFGFGGLEDLVVESRVLFKGNRRAPFALSVETFYELEGDQRYYGVGLTPARDPRNRFQPNTRHQFGLYDERQARGLVSLGARLSPNLESFMSVSLSRRQVEDSDGVGDRALSSVFVPGSVFGVRKDTWIVYAESAARFDSRPHRGRPVPGSLAEAYFGGGQSTDGPPVSFLRAGWRGATFFPVYRSTNIISPRLVFDRIVPLNGLDIPFTELVRQPDFRGFDRRRDFVSIVGSVDYTWEAASIVGFRIFLDAATVAPSVKEMDFDQVRFLRYAFGFGLDLYTSTAQLGQVLLSTSPEGVRLLLSLGAIERFGDRQHQN